MTINDRPTAADLRHVIRALRNAYREATDPAEKELARIQHDAFMKHLREMENEK